MDSDDKIVDLSVANGDCKPNFPVDLMHDLLTKRLGPEQKISLDAVKLLCHYADLIVIEAQSRAKNEAGSDSREIVSDEHVKRVALEILSEFC